MHSNHGLEIDVNEICTIFASNQTQEEDVPRVHPLRVKSKQTVSGQGIITCDHDWWEGVCGREVIWLIRVQQSFLSQSLNPPIRNSWIRPCIRDKSCIVLGFSFRAIGGDHVPVKIWPAAYHLSNAHCYCRRRLGVIILLRVRCRKKSVFLGFSKRKFRKVKRTFSTPSRSPGVGGRGVLPNMGYIGMCGPKGRVFQPFCS